jgi:hypothetical protein
MTYDVSGQKQCNTMKLTTVSKSMTQPGLNEQITSSLGFLAMNDFVDLSPAVGLELSKLQVFESFIVVDRPHALSRSYDV